ncbi:type II toxin-antitoxin system HicA family toxin [Neomoorella mulderi]|uniref:type II toxin-antitoxin system HicA family toxin n=1 Tax=Neomoorella mulderi TaxID=202604 RepID=UPI0007807461
MKSYSSREILQILKEDGWIIKGQEGSHVQLVHPTKPGKVTVKHPKKTLKTKTVISIFKQAGLKIK